MSNNRLWIWTSRGEQGDFSDLESHHEYQCGNITDAVQAEAEAVDRGDNVIWAEAPIDPDEPVQVEPGQYLSRWESSQDSQGVDYPRRK